jgi:DNA-binding MarR family transcriptional regulator
LQRLNRFIVKAGKTPFSLTESHILVEIEHFPGINAASIAKLLGLQRSTVTRSLNSLRQRKVVRHLPSAGRGTALALTARGRQLIAQGDKDANARMSALTDGLNAAEVLTLGAYLDRVAAGLATAPSPARPGEHALRPSIRRLTRGAGLLNDNFMQSGLSSSAWQILESIARGEAQSILELSHFLGLARSTVSLLVGKLERRELVVKGLHHLDGRRSVLSLSQNGKNCLAALHERVGGRFEQALLDFSPEEKEECIALFKRLGQKLESAKVPLEGSKIQIFALKDEERLRRARGFVIEELVSRSMACEVPRKLLEGCLCSALELDGKIAAVVEIAQGLAPADYAISLCLAGEKATPLLLLALLQFTLAAFFKDAAQAAVTLQQDNPLIDPKLNLGLAKTLPLKLEASSWRQIIS